MLKSFYKNLLIVAAGILPAAAIYGQDSLDNRKDIRFKRVAIASTLSYSVGLIGLNTLWYSDYEKSSFHAFNDNKEWLQIDKVGHAYSSYNLTNLSYSLYTSSEELNKKALLYSSGSAFIFLTSIEVFDGFSKEWGFSWGDFGANTAGVLLFTGQELIFDKQIMRLKYSYANSPYQKYRPNTLGENTLEGAFKDYNGQTYWASFNLSSLNDHLKPKWLNMAFGYGGKQMIYANQSFISDRGQMFSQQRQYYLSLDVDWEQIETHKKWLKWCFKVANCIKIPAPTIEWTNSNKPNYHLIYF